MTTDTPTPPQSPSTRRRAVTARWGRLAAAMLPHALLFSAVFQKEMRVSGRRNSTFVTRGVYAVLLVALATLVFMGARSGIRDERGAAAIQELQGIAPVVTMSVLWMQMILLPLVVCMVTGPSVCEEVRNRSLPALLTTPLSAAQVVFSKLSGAMVQISILAMLALPLLLGLRVFGGLDPMIVLGGTAITLTTTLLAGSVGMLCSVLSRRAAMAGSGAVAYTIALLFLPLPILFLLASRFPALQAIVTDVVFTVSGPVAMGMILIISSGGPGPIPATIPEVIAANVAYNLVASLLILATASGIFRRRLTGDRGEAVMGAADRPRGPRVRRRRRASAPPSEPGATTPGASGPTTVATTQAAAPPADSWPEPANRTVGDHPVLWREVRRQGVRAASRRVGLFSAVFAMAMLGVLGVLLPLLGMFDALFDSSQAWSPGATDQASPLMVVTGAFTLGVLALIVLTAFRSLKRIATGQAIVVPPRPVFIGAMVFGVLIFAYWGVEGEYEGLHHAIAALGPGLVFLRAATQNAGTLAEEREARTLDTLLTTRLTPREILLGKLAGSLVRQWDIPALVLLHYLVAGCLLQGLPITLPLHMGVLMLGGVAFLSGTGMLCALLASKGSVASMLNAGLALGLWLALPIATSLATTALGVDDDVNQALGTAMLGGQPLPLGLFAVRGAIDSTAYRSQYDVMALELSPWQFTGLVIGVATAYAALGAVAFLGACRMFNRKTGRTS